MYSIKITYSWGDEEPLYGKYKTQREAFIDMVNLAAREVYVQNEEFFEEATCKLYIDAFNKEIDLHYDSDGEVCYYRLEKVK